MPLYPPHFYKACLCDHPPIPRIVSLDGDIKRQVCRECFTSLELSPQGRQKVIEECNIYTKCINNVKYKQLLQNLERNDSKKAPKTRTHTWITIAIQEYAYENIEKLLNTKIKYLKNAQFAHEFFSGEDSHENPHIHILVCKVIDKSRVIRDLSRLFKVKSNFIDIRYGDDADKENRELYMKGEKKDENKRMNVTLDNERREKLKIKSLYKI